MTGISKNEGKKLYFDLYRIRSDSTVGQLYVGYFSIPLNELKSYDNDTVTRYVAKNYKKYFSDYYSKVSVLKDGYRMKFTYLETIGGGSTYYFLVSNIRIV